MQPETENQKAVGGAKREAAPSYTALPASLAPALGVEKVSSDPESRFSSKVAEKTGTELILRFFFLQLHYFQIHVNKRQRDTIQWLLSSTCGSG